MDRNLFFFCGSSSVTIPSRNEKYILASHATEWPNLEGVIEWRTAGEIARLELKRAFPDLRKVGWHRGHIRLFDKLWPFACLKQYEGDATHLDIKSAYLQIYRKLQLDVAFPCGKGGLSLQPVAERLEGHKLARNAVIGVIRSRQAFATKGHKRITLSTKNPFLSPCLWATVQGILHELAQMAIELSAVYVATDGYIFTDHMASNIFKQILDDYGLLYRYEIGPTKINGWGNYSSPSKTTHLYHTVSDLPKFKEINNISPFYQDQPNKLLNFWKKL